MSDNVTRKYFGSPDDHSQGTKSASGSAFAVPECKAFIEMDDGSIVEEELVEEITKTLALTQMVVDIAKAGLN